MTNIPLTFEGPFTFTDADTSVFRLPWAASSGIYLWTIKQRRDDTHLIHYIGETTSLGDRHREHLTNILGLEYGVFDPEKAQEGVCEVLWKGLWRDKSLEGPSRQIEAYQKFHEEVIRYLAVLSIFFAELKTEDRRRKHIEGCIGSSLRDDHAESKTLYPDDNRVMTMGDKINGELLITSFEDIKGLDPRIPY